MSALDVERDLLRVAALCAALAGRRVAVARADARLPSGRLARARRELEHVQRAEFALLLRRAAALKLCAAPPHGAALAAGLSEVLELAQLEGWRWPRRLERLALRLGAREPRRWPAALRLARAAHALAPSLASRALVAEALAAEGRTREALGGLAGALARLPRGSRPPRLVRTLEGLLERVACDALDARLARACARLRRSLAAERAA